MNRKFVMASAIITDAQQNKGESIMWYFAWLLGLPLAAAFAVLNAMWYELMEDEAQKKRAKQN